MPPLRQRWQTGTMAQARSTADRTVPWVIYDGDCAFCSLSSGWLQRLLHNGHIPDVVRIPWQFVDLASAGIEPGRPQQEALWLALDGHVYGGARAVAQWLRYRGGAFIVAGALMDAPLVAPLADAMYRLIAANRHRLPGGTATCAMVPPPDARPQTDA